MYLSWREEPILEVPSLVLGEASLRHLVPIHRCRRASSLEISSTFLIRGYCRVYCCSAGGTASVLCSLWPMKLPDCTPHKHICDASARTAEPNRQSHLERCRASQFKNVGSPDDTSPRRRHQTFERALKMKTRAKAVVDCRGSISGSLQLTNDGLVSCNID